MKERSILQQLTQDASSSTAQDHRAVPIRSDSELATPPSSSDELGGRQDDSTVPIRSDLELATPPSSSDELGGRHAAGLGAGAGAPKHGSDSTLSAVHVSDMTGYSSWEGSDGLPSAMLQPVGIPLSEQDGKMLHTIAIGLCSPWMLTTTQDKARQLLRKVKELLFPSPPPTHPRQQDRRRPPSGTESSDVSGGRSRKRHQRAPRLPPRHSTTGTRSSARTKQRGKKRKSRGKKCSSAKTHHLNNASQHCTDGIAAPAPTLAKLSSSPHEGMAV